MSDAINPDHYKRLPAEAIESIEAAIDKAPSNQDALLHGQALKYLLRCWHKNGIEDLRKAKWYLDRLIDSSDEGEQQPVIKQSSTTEPPDGWRWLEVGEKLFLGDTTVNADGTPYSKSTISKQYCERHICQLSKTFIRRNKFKYDEKVVHVDDDEPIVYVVKGFRKDGAVLSLFRNIEYALNPNKLAPYIEEQS